LPELPLGQGSSPPDPDGVFLEAFLVSTVVVGLAEIGDKTQILSLMLAARFALHGIGVYPI
jgi:hypothetical protein